MTFLRPKTVLTCFLVPVFAFWLPLGVSTLAASPDSDVQEDPALVKLVEADWAFQEKQRDRTPDNPAAIGDLLSRAEKLFADLKPSAPLKGYIEKFQELKQKAQNLDQLDTEARRALYHELRWTLRRAALKNPLVAETPIAFLKRRRFACQMLHEYLGYYYQRSGTDGGEVCILKNPGFDMSIDRLTEGHLPKGAYTTLALSHDAKRLYFAFADMSEVKNRPSKPIHWKALSAQGSARDAWNAHLKEEKGWFHLFSINTDGSDLRQLTSGVYGDFDPCPLPDGSLAFMSSRRGGYGRCHGGWEPLPVYTLHRLGADGKKIDTLSYHETNEWHPSVLSDGRIVYSRWDYIDRWASRYHGLWVTNPDGTQTSALFGNYTLRVNACYQPKAIPGSNRILFIAGAHHSAVGGSLAILDPSRVRLNRQSGEDTFEAIERLTPEVPFPEAIVPGIEEQWPSTYYHSPWPLSENYFLVSYSREPLAGYGPNQLWDGRTGLYYLDRFGNLELLYEDPEISCQYPLPLVARPMPRTIPARLDPKLAERNEAEIMLTDVHETVIPIDSKRKIDHLRIFQLLPKGPGYVSNNPSVGHPHAVNARMLLGTVPVEPNGSAYFRVPAGKPLYFQAVDTDGRAVLSMRSEVYFQPGERRSCVGCHEPIQSTPANPVSSVASTRPPSTIQPGPDGSHPMSYVRLVQPILDRHCVKCHTGSDADKANQLDLTSAPTKRYNRSYESLRPFLRWYEWGDLNLRRINTPPGFGGTDQCPLTDILNDKNHGELFSKIPESDRRRLYLWMDANVPFYGTMVEKEMAKQREGEAIEDPRLQ